MKLLQLLLYCLFFSMQSYAYITNVISWEKDGHKVIGCGDVHDYHMLYDNVAQRKFLFDHLATLDRQETCILVEDDQEYRGSNQSIAEFVAQSPVMFPQDGLISLTKRRIPGIETVNLEYRYARSAALNKFVQNDHDSPVAAWAVLQEFDAMVSTVRSYKDGERLTKLYHDTTANLSDGNAAVLERIRQFPGTMTEWIRSQVPADKQKIFARRLRIFDACLLDFCAIHSIAHSPLQKHIIFAGAAHIFNIGKILESMLGFQRTSAIGIVIDTPYTNPSLAIETLRPLAPEDQALSLFKPLPAKQLKVLFE